MGVAAAIDDFDRAEPAAAEPAGKFGKRETGRVQALPLPLRRSMDR